MGRIWKFTEQVYEELGEAADKKVTTRFDEGLCGVFNNPFEKYADEVALGISKMNSYVDMINEAEGFILESWSGYSVRLQPQIKVMEVRFKNARRI